MRRVWTVLRRWGPASIEYVPHGAVLATMFGTLLFDVRTLDEFLVWGAWGALFGLLTGTVVALLAERATRRRRERARELIGASATDADCDVAIRASVRGPVPVDPAIRRAAGQMAAARERTGPRKNAAFLAFGCLAFAAAVWTSTDDLGNWPTSGAGFVIVSQQMEACRAHRRAARLGVGSEA